MRTRLSGARCAVFQSGRERPPDDPARVQVDGHFREVRYDSTTSLLIPPVPCAQAGQPRTSGLPGPGR